MADKKGQQEKSDHETIEKTHRIVKENYEMLRAMRREAWIGFFIKIIVWLAILGVPVYLYFTFLQPFFSELQTTYEGVQTSTQEAQNLSDRLQEFLQRFNQ